MIELRNISLHAGTFSLQNISVSIPGPYYAVLMGRTGVGKTTLLETICGLRPVDSGEILLNGAKITHLPPAQREIGYVPQDLALFPTMTVRAHLEFALRLRRIGPVEMRQRVGELSEVLQIESILDRKVPNLSGGEAQRVALGRALSFRPSMLLLDEPLSALDDETRTRMQNLLKRVQQMLQVPVLHVTHHREEADLLADRLYLLEDSRIIEQPIQTARTS